ncbi:MAG TPA: hypothetical protein VF585_04920 [Chthoniobacterales bacterium]
MFRFVFSLSLALTAICAIAQEPATITVQKGALLNAHIKGISGGDGAKAASVLANDLTLSSAFGIGAESSANFVISGSSSGGSLQGRVVDRSGNTILEKTYSGDTRSAAHQFADDIVETVTGNPGIATTKLAFVGNASGKKEIYTSDYDGANVRQLTRDGGISVSPALSPNGRQLLYTGYQSGYADIYRIDLGSGARNRVVKSPGTNSGASFAPGGGSFAATLSKDGNPELYIVGLGGGGARRLTNSRTSESSPSFSPSGDEIVYSSDAGGQPQLFRISAGGGTGSRLNTGYGYCTEPNWSPDGKKIAFNVREGGNFAVAIYNVSSGNTKVVTSGGDAEDPTWARDSRHLFFAQNQAVYLLDVTTGKQVKVVSGVGKISEPSASR